MAKFEIPKDNWKLIPIESAIFILNENKDYIDYTIKESEKITNRAYSLVIFLSTILSAVVGYTYSRLIENDYSNIVFLNFFLAVILTLFIIYLSKLIFPREIMAKGRKPIELAKKEYLVNSKLTNEQNHLTFIIQEIENSQIKIDFNLDQNIKRIERLKYTMIIIAILFPTYLLIAFFFS